MFLGATRLYNLDLTEAFMVGDKYTDIAAFSNAGIKINYLVKSNPSEKSFK